MLQLLKSCSQYGTVCWVKVERPQSTLLTWNLVSSCFSLDYPIQGCRGRSPLCCQLPALPVSMDHWGVGLHTLLVWWEKEFHPSGPYMGGCKFMLNVTLDSIFDKPLEWKKWEKTSCRTSKVYETHLPSHSHNSFMDITQDLFPGSWK